MLFHPSQRNTLILSSAAVILLAAGIFFLLQTKNAGPDNGTTPTINPTPTDGTPEGWKTYRNEELGFEVSHPGEWRDRAAGNNLIFIEKPMYSEGSGFGIEIKFINRSSDDVYEETVAAYQTQIISEDMVTFAGLKNVSELKIDSSFGDNFSILLVPQNHGTFAIKRGLGSTEGVHNQILSTFRFIP